MAVENFRFDLFASVTRPSLKRKIITWQWKVMVSRAVSPHTGFSLNFTNWTLFTFQGVYLVDGFFLVLNDKNSTHNHCLASLVNCNRRSNHLSRLLRLLSCGTFNGLVFSWFYFACFFSQATSVINLLRN